VASGVLYLVGTPIGNLGDMTDRARETLGSADLVAAEDTRRTGLLLKRLGVRARLVSLHEANERERTTELVRRLLAGEHVAVVSDAGMPGLSDPGFQLVRACVEEGIDVRVVPGPSAAIAALVVSGLPTDRFAYEGFLPRRRGDRRARLQALASDSRTVVLFESPKRVRATLGEALKILGDRRAAVARELTKLHEEVLRGPISELLPRVDDLKGEVVVVLEGAAPRRANVASLLDEARALVANGMRARDAATRVARGSGVSANDLYRALLDEPKPRE